MTEHSKPEPLKSVPPLPDALPGPPPDSLRVGAPLAAVLAVDNVIDLVAAKERLHAQNAGEQMPTPSTVPTDAASFFDVRDKRPLPLLTPPMEPHRFRLRVEIDDSTPPIWRSLSLPSDIRLDRLHDVIQVAIGWEDTHLHQFTTANDPLGYETAGILTAFALAEGDEGVLESQLRLDQLLAAPGDILHYTYDFGDGWDHTLTLDLVEPAEPVASSERAAAPTDSAMHCLDGARTGPPEDIGGMAGYNHLIEVLGNTEHPEYRAMLPTIFHLDMFSFVDEIDLIDIDRGLARLDRADAGLAWLDRDAGDMPEVSQRHIQLRVLFAQMGAEAQRHLAGYLGAAVAPQVDALDAAAIEKATAVIRSYLRYLGEGLTLTAAGYLSPKHVSALMHELDPDQVWTVRARREVDAAPLLSLREVVITLGLARKYKGALVPTKLGRTLRDSPAKLWAALVNKLPLETSEHGRDIGLLLLILVASGAATSPQRVSTELDRLSSMIGWELHSGGRYGNSAAFSDVLNTGLLLTWAGTGRLLPRNGWRGGLEQPGALLLAGAALRS